MHTRLNEVKLEKTNLELLAIHEKMVRVTEELKTCEFKVIRCLQEVDKFLVHRFVGYNSLYQYAIQALHLTEHQAYTYITVARKSAELPELQSALQTGELTVSKARRIASVINDDNQTEWIEMAKISTKRDIERCVADENPQAINHERARFLNGSMMELQTPISEEDYNQLLKVQNLMSQEESRHVPLKEVIKKLCAFYLERKDPVAKAERATTKKSKTQLGPGRVETTNSRKIPAKNIHEVNIRDQGKCQVVLPNGKPCHEGRWTEIHHLHPYSKGGGHDPENLVTLCQAHHQMIHVTDFQGPHQYDS